MVAGDPGGAEGVGHRRVAVADQQRPLEEHGQPLDQPAGAGLEPGRVGGAASSRSTAAAARSSRGSAALAGATSSSSAARPSGCLASTRRTSRLLTLPAPSQMELSGASRYSRGMPLSSTYPLPPRHSSASAATAGARLHTQYLATAVASRRRAASAGSPAARSNAPATRMASSVAASDSTARSARTLVISGWSASRRPNALRWAAWWVAWATAWRSSAADPTTQSSRVWLTISRMAARPRPGSPTSQPVAPSSSTSAEALARLPSLSLSRCRWKPLRPPSGSTRGTRKQLSPAGAWARTRKASLIGAEQNHLCPVSRHSPSPAGAAVVVLARTSLPPCFSVMAMPHSAPALPATGARTGS